jgi:hypothetical protein
MSIDGAGDIFIDGSTGDPKIDPRERAALAALGIVCVPYARVNDFSKRLRLPPPQTHQ